MGGLLDFLVGLARPWAYVAVGVLTTLEAAAFVGLVVPGETALLIGGFIASQGRADPVIMAIVAAVGAIVGDSIGYEVGRHLGPSLRQSRLGRRVGKRWDRATDYLQRKGGQAVFFGRFVGVLRALVPTVAGMSQMPYRTFLPWNALGGIVWAPGFVLLGYLAGNSFRTVERYAGRASLVVFGALLLIGTTVYVARKLLKRESAVRAWIEHQIERPALVGFRKRYARPIELFRQRLSPSGAYGLSLTVSVLVLVAAGWAFGAVLQDVLARDELFNADGAVMVFFATHRSQSITEVMRIVSFVGSDIALGVVVALGSMFGWYATRNRTWLAFPIISIVGLIAIVQILQHLIDRARPPTSLAVVAVSGASVPSGEVAATLVAFGSVALIAAAAYGWTVKVAVPTAALIMTGLVALSDLYLGVHWLTDIVGGATLGALWLVASFSLLKVLGTPLKDSMRGHPSNYTDA